MSIKQKQTGKHFTNNTNLLRSVLNFVRNEDRLILEP